MRMVIAVCTLDRPDGLRRVLDGLMRQAIDGRADDDISIIVVDNSAEATAAAAIGDGTDLVSRHRLEVVHEPRRGLANARNAALDAALAAGADFLVFIDDDEVPETGWLASICAAMDDPAAVAGVGPVYPVFAAPPPRWLPTDAYATVARLEQGRVTAGYTGNSIIRLAAVARAGCRFDPAFNESGGEDTDFFARLVSGGGHIAYAPEARVLESVPAGRMTLGWLARRWYRTGLVEAKASMAGGSAASAVARASAKGVARIAGGTLRVAWSTLVSWRRPDVIVARLYTLCRGCGYVAGAMGATRREYRADARVT